jgi:hypothetical protein
MRVPRSWFLFPAYDLAIGAANKCGTQSLRVLQVDTIGFERREDFSLVPKSYKRVGIIRHPVARFLSLYGNIQERKFFRKENNFYRQFEGVSPEETLERLVAEGMDHDFHYQEQYKIGWLDNPQTILVRLHAISEWWAENRPAVTRPFPHKNANNSAYRPSDALRERIESVYKHDLALWNKAYGGTYTTPDS